MNIAKALLLISACLVAGSTFAADDKTWSSVACRGYGLNTSDSELTFQNAGLYNPQNNYETVICPIEMDREGGWGTTSTVDQADINVSFRMGSVPAKRSEEHTSELQSLMRISYAVFCLKKKKHNIHKQK